jgi:hypothetical protein
VVGRNPTGFTRLLRSGRVKADRFHPTSPVKPDHFIRVNPTGFTQPLFFRVVGFNPTTFLRVIGLDNRVNDTRRDYRVFTSLPPNRRLRDDAFRIKLACCPEDRLAILGACRPLKVGSSRFRRPLSVGLDDHPDTDALLRACQVRAVKDRPSAFKFPLEGHAF